MSRGKSQSNLNLDERANKSQSFPNDQDPTTPSTVSTKTRETFKSAFFNFIRDFKKRHKNKQYQHIMRLGARRWRAMTQADRAPYVLEAARNRRIDKPKSKPTRKNNEKKKKDKDTHSKHSRTSERRCPACGHRRTSGHRSSTGSVSSHISSFSGTRSSKSSNSK